ncbi:MAG TPA: Crp/Fnr family transcriptional regulator [Candidatus Tumulicola sp.]|nr:Crp/Fnr family transcriptional regulator [Candidatus Tumulicola sp.]
MFAGIGKRLLARLAGAAIESRVGPNETFAPQGQPFPFLGVVAEGAVVAIISSRDGREQMLYQSVPDETFAEVPSLDGRVTLYRFAAGARGALSLLIPRLALEEACEASAELGLRLGRVVSERARILADCLTHLAFETTLERITRAIRSYIPREAAGWVDASPELKGLSQNQLAELSGTVRIVVARALRSLAAANVIELDGGRIKRVNADTLAHQS